MQIRAYTYESGLKLGPNSQNKFFLQEDFILFALPLGSNDEAEAWKSLVNTI